MPNPPAAAELGFVGDETSGWTKVLRGHGVNFRLLRTLDELTDAEVLQTDVFQVSERDLLSNVTLLSVAESGGAVIGAYLAEQPARPVGALIGWGGFHGRPRIVSDFLAVRPEARNLGLGAELKRLQAALALERGFEEVVWTVDPLRAVNARLNFTKLGAISRHYEIDRYGSAFAAGLYGGLPTDRLHITWEITSPRVIDRLRGVNPASEIAHLANLRQYRPGVEDNWALVDIPEDIDTLMVASTTAAWDWRMRVRSRLTAAFAEGFAITGFEPGSMTGNPAYLVSREGQLAWSGHPER